MPDPYSASQPPPLPQESYGYYGGAMQPHRGTMILVFGILGLACCVIFGIVAWVMGTEDLKKMDAGMMDPEGRNLTYAGKICGMISVPVTILAVIVGILSAVLQNM